MNKKMTKNSVLAATSSQVISKTIQGVVDAISYPFESALQNKRKIGKTLSRHESRENISINK